METEQNDTINTENSELSISKISESKIKTIVGDMHVERQSCIPDRLRISNITFIVLIAFFSGLYDLTTLSFFYYQKDILSQTPQTIQLIMGIIYIPWNTKPIFGYISDFLIKKLKKTKRIVAITSITKITVFSILAHNKPGTTVFYMLQFIFIFTALFENIISEYILVKDTNRLNQKENSKKHNQLPIFFGFRAFGSLIGNFLGGRLIELKSIQFPFFVTSFFPLITLLGVLLFKEEPIDADKIKRKTMKEELVDLKKLIFKRNMILFMLVICLINITPNFNTLVKFYLIDKLEFNSTDLSNFKTFAKLCLIFGTFLYYFCLKGVNPRRFYVCSNFILWTFNMSFLFVVLGIITKLGINPKIFCLLTNGAFALFVEMNFMPILAICSSLCTDSLEATSITLFTCIISLSEGLSYYIGSLIMWMTNIHMNNYNGFWKLIVLQNSYLFVMIIFVAFIPFPDPAKAKKKKIEEEIKDIEGMKDIGEIKNIEEIRFDTSDSVN